MMVASIFASFAVIGSGYRRPIVVGTLTISVGFVLLAVEPAGLTLAGIALASFYADPALRFDHRYRGGRGESGGQQRLHQAHAGQSRQYYPPQTDIPADGSGDWCRRQHPRSQTQRQHGPGLYRSLHSLHRIALVSIVAVFSMPESPTAALPRSAKL